MKRIVSLIDGTWNEEGKGNDTNIAKLDPNYAKAGAPLIRPRAADGTRQIAFYHDGVGSDPDLLKHLLGGAIGIGLKKIVQDAYRHIAENYARGDELHILGFSRGAYAARALAGLIGASGIQASVDPQNLDTVFDAVWNHFRVDPDVRQGKKAAGSSDQKAIDTLPAWPRDPFAGCDRARLVLQHRELRRGARQRTRALERDRPPQCCILSHVRKAGQIRAGQSSRGDSGRQDCDGHARRAGAAGADLR